MDMVQADTSNYTFIHKLSLSKFIHPRDSLGIDGTVWE